MQLEFVSSVALVIVFIKHCFICLNGLAAITVHQLSSDLPCIHSKCAGIIFFIFFTLTPSGSSTFGPLTSGITFAFAFLQKQISSHLEVSEFN